MLAVLRTLHPPHYDGVTSIAVAGRDRHQVFEAMPAARHLRCPRSSGSRIAVHNNTQMLFKPNFLGHVSTGFVSSELSKQVSSLAELSGPGGGRQVL